MRVPPSRTIPKRTPSPQTRRHADDRTCDREANCGSAIDRLLPALQGLADSMGLDPMPPAVTVRRGLTCDRNDETERFEE